MSEPQLGVLKIRSRLGEGCTPRLGGFGVKVGALGLGFALGGVGLMPGAGAIPPEWVQEGDRLTTVCQFADFATAVAFVERLVEPADRLGHHPDLAIAYNQVAINLTTHDAGGLTALDFALAEEISALHDGQCQPPTHSPTP